MHREHQVKALEGMLSYWGLDVGRYTSALANSFLHQFPDPSAWSSEEARSALIATFAIGETTFLRHPEHFAALRALLPELTMRHDGPLRVWSAGCASGEEAYSLAALVSTLGTNSFEVRAWDLNPEAVARARLGEYRPWSLRGVESQDTEGWLEPSPCGVKVASWLAPLVQFEVRNLLLDAYPENLDIVFCRNVLLYFRPEAAARVLARIADSLRPGGVLILGHYDPRPGPLSCLVEEWHNGTVYYRKPRAQLIIQQQSLPSYRPPPPPPIAATTDTFTAAIGTPEARMEMVRQLSNQRRTGQALAILNDLAESAPLHPTVHVLTALVAEDAGNLQLMLHAARRACFLLPEHPAPNYFLSVAFARNGELRRAAVHRRIAAHSLRRAPRLSTVLDYSEGLTVGQLRRLIGGFAK
jgi:chemotaxis protein methyltransferase CheR